MNRDQVIEAIDRTVGYLEDEEEDYELSDPERRRGHIWGALRVLIEHRADLADQSH
jgi:hypothetical protein